MAKIFITGVSGTGKTTLTNALQEKGYYAISLDEHPGLCRWKDKESGTIVDYKATLDEKFIRAHGWICDIGKLMELMSAQPDPVFVLGTAANQQELLPLFDTVFLLACPPETFIRRILQRTDNDFGKEESAQRYILETYQDFEDEMLQSGAIRINAEQEISAVLGEVLRRVL